MHSCVRLILLHCAKTRNIFCQQQIKFITLKCGVALNDLLNLIDEKPWKKGTLIGKYFCFYTCVSVFLPFALFSGFLAVLYNVYNHFVNLSQSLLRLRVAMPSRHSPNNLHWCFYCHVFLQSKALQRPHNSHHINIFGSAAGYHCPNYNSTTTLNSNKTPLFFLYLIFQSVASEKGAA